MTFFYLVHCCRFGRKPMALVPLLTEGLSFFLSGFMQNYWLFMLLKCTMGFCSLGYSHNFIILGMPLFFSNFFIIQWHSFIISLPVTDLEESQWHYFPCWPKGSHFSFLVSCKAIGCSCYLSVSWDFAALVIYPIFLYLVCLYLLFQSWFLDSMCVNFLVDRISAPPGCAEIF